MQALCFFFCLLKIPLSKPKLKSQAMGTCLLLKASVLHCVHSICKDSGAVGLHKTTSHTKIPMTKPKDTSKSFQDKEDWNREMRTEGEVKGGGTERTGNGKEAERLPFPPTHCGCLFRSQPTLPERAQGEGTLSTVHQGDQAWETVCCTSCLGL